MKEGTFTERLAKLIEDKGVSRTTVAKATGISEGTFTKWFDKAEEGRTIKPRESNLEALATYFKVSIDWLRTGQFANINASIAQVNDASESKSLAEILALQNEKLIALIDRNTEIIFNLTK